MKFLYPELGAVDPTLPRDQRLRQLASIITSEKNGRLGRTIVNRLWKKFLGRGLVEPVDEMDNDPWNADLLDYLAVQLATTDKWDLKKTIARILSPQAYQMPMAPVAENGNEQFTFRGPVAKRLTAEEFVDALDAVTGVWPAKPAYNPAASSFKLPHRKARWVWSTPKANQSAAPGTVYFRKAFDLDSVTAGELIVTADNRFVLYVNGKRAAAGEDWGKPVTVDLRPYLISNGKNVIAVEAENTTTSPNPAGLFLSGKITHRKVAGSPAIELATNATWVWSVDKPGAAWTTSAFDAAGWKPAAELGDEKVGPWNLTKSLASVVVAAPAGEAVRAALCTADPLTTALGRSNREQVLTDRASVATTLQALEMSNGATLSEMLKRGAAKLAAEAKSPDELTDRLFLRALGRPPTAGERQTATEMLGAPVKPEAVEDLLWVIAMLPEFQLIR